MSDTPRDMSEQWRQAHNECFRAVQASSTVRRPRAACPRARETPSVASTALRHDCLAALQHGDESGDFSGAPARCPHVVYAKRVWSQINRDNVARLIKAGRMTEHGQRQVDAAKADGRWAAAYAPIRTATEAGIPADLRAAIGASPPARAKFRTLSRMNIFALAKSGCGRSCTA